MIETYCKYIFGPSNLNYLITRWVKMVGISCTASLRAWHLALCSLWMGTSATYPGMVSCCLRSVALMVWVCIVGLHLASSIRSIFILYFLQGL